MQINNNAVMEENAIANLYQCACTHKDYGYIVPVTPELGNREECSVLYNPVYLMPMDVLVQSAYDAYESGYYKKKGAALQDVDSAWMQNNGYQCIVAKDACCHYFESVTLKYDAAM